MKKYIITLLFCTLFCHLGIAQGLKSVSILGDSYSTFEGYVQPDTNFVWYLKTPLKRTEDRYGFCACAVASVCGEQLPSFCVNNSFSGATICHTGYRSEDYSDRSFITRMKALGCPDIIFIFGATNDYWAKSPLGEYQYADWSKKDLYSFRPAMAYMLDTMIDYYPNVEIYFLLNDGLGNEITESVRTICKHYQIDCIELKGLDKMSGHPSVKGMKQISEQVKAYMAAHGK